MIKGGASGEEQETVMESKAEVKLWKKLFLLCWGLRTQNSQPGNSVSESSTP